MMFQSYALWPHMTVAQNVAFGLIERKVAKAEIDRRVGEALESVKMSPYAARKIAQLSGGQQQRVALARALVIRPRAPPARRTALEPRCKASPRDARRNSPRLQRIRPHSHLRDARSEGGPLDFRPHGNPRGGHIAQIGDPQSVYRRPKSKIVADFIGETNFIEGRIAAASNGQARVETPLGSFVGVLSDSDWQPPRGRAGHALGASRCWRIELARPSQNTVAGRIGESTYLGEVAQYQFEPSSGAGLKIFELNPDLTRRPQDRELYATADPDDVVVLRK